VLSTKEYSFSAWFMSSRDYCIGYDRSRAVPGNTCMWQLASVIGEIALRRRGPESLPESTFLVGLLFGILFLLTFVSWLVTGSLSVVMVGRLAAQTALLFAFVFAVLAYFKLERRYRQTLSAILGVNILVLLVYFPFLFGGIVLDLEIDQAPFFVSLRIALFLWSVLMEASIFARALSQPLILGFMVEILYVLPGLSINEYFASAGD
jgi:hypothetical protein